MFEIIHTDECGQMWVFRWIATTRSRLLRLIGDYAADSECSFNWDDAARVVAQVRMLNG